MKTSTKFRIGEIIFANLVLFSSLISIELFLFIIAMSLFPLAFYIILKDMYFIKYVKKND